MDDADVDDPLPTTNAPVAAVSEQSVNDIVNMGFTPAVARKALLETGGSFERAIDWALNHPHDNGEDASGASSSMPPLSIAQLPGHSGIPASYRLRAFISHKGPSVHTGHYVAHIHQKDAGWVLFNDEKVVKADHGAQGADKLAPLAYVYLFERLEGI